MPYIKIRTNKQVGEDQASIIKSKLGSDISILGKSEDWLMVDIEEANNLYFRGEKTDIAYVEVKLFGRCDASHYNNMTKEITTNINTNLGINPDNIYVSYFETSNWGWNGKNF